MRSVFIGILGVLLLAGAVLHSQTSIVRNPRAVAFTCPDHATDDAHEVAIVRESDGVTIQTLAGGDPAAGTTGEVEVALNVQPITFGRYRVQVRAGAAGQWSDWSDPSEVWERAPGKPSGVVVR